MTILDTHAWIWWITAPHRLSRGALRAITTARAVGLSAISCWELAMLVARKRVSLDRGVLQWIERSLNEKKIELLSLTPAIAVRASQLAGDTLPDPTDRLIVATSLVHEAVLVTKDDAIRQSGLTQCKW